MNEIILCNYIYVSRKKIAFHRKDVSNDDMLDEVKK